MTKAEYREVFKKIDKSDNKNNIVMIRLLKELGISSGNFYYFLAHDEDGKGDRTMSVEKLERLYNAMAKEGLIPTNRARLESLDTDKMVKELFKRFDLEKSGTKEKDVTKWMNSYIGKEFRK